MLPKMGGFQVHGPRTHHSNTQLRWISKQFISEDCRVKNWRERWSRRLCGTSWIMNDGVLALPVHDFPLIEPGMLDILEKFPLLSPKMLWECIGSQTLEKLHWGEPLQLPCKLQSNYTPGFREASEFDSFRGESGRQDRPDIFDDGSLPEQSMRKLKGFCDVGNTVLTKERWGAAKFPHTCPMI